MESNEVAQLQTYLATDETFYPEGRITGYFGPLTAQAVKRFQAQYGLPTVGRVGPLTRAKLAEVFASATPAPSPAPPTTPSPAPAPAAAVTFTKPLRPGSRGDEVSALQSFLANDPAIYPEGLVTGYFGPATQKAVKNFQAKYGIDTLGIVGPATRAKLNELSGAQTAPSVSPAPEPAPSSTSAPATAEDLTKITELQAQLKALQDQLNALQVQ